jgi:hypothetical protein
MNLKVNSNARVFVPAVAVAAALRFAFDIQHRNWAYAKGVLAFLDWLSPCVVLAGGVAFFWSLFRHKTHY